VFLVFNIDRAFSCLKSVLVVNSAFSLYLAICVCVTQAGIPSSLENSSYVHQQVQVRRCERALSRI